MSSVQDSLRSVIFGGVVSNHTQTTGLCRWALPFIRHSPLVDAFATFTHLRTFASSSRTRKRQIGTSNVPTGRLSEAFRPPRVMYLSSTTPQDSRRRAICRATNARISATNWDSVPVKSEISVSWLGVLAGSCRQLFVMPQIGPYDVKG